MHLFYVHVLPTSVKYTPWGRKKNRFFCAHLFSYLTETEEFFTYIRLKESRSIKLQFRLFNFGMRKEFCSDSDIEHYMFTSQVMKLMITG